MAAVEVAVPAPKDAPRSNKFLLRNKEKLKMNQYWYSAATIEAMVADVEAEAKAAAFLSTPSVYFSLRDENLRANSKLLDFDEAFARDPGFVKFDFKAPDKIPAELEGRFDFVVIDPPFITTEVWEKYAAAARFLLAKGTEQRVVDGKQVTLPRGKLLLSTIPEHGRFLEQLLGVKPASFLPSIPNLIYQYNFYINYPSKHLAVLNPEVAADGGPRQGGSVGSLFGVAS